MKTKDATATNGGAKGDNLQHTLEHGVERATSAAHHTIDSLSDAAQPAIDHLRSGAHKAVDSAGGVATHAAGALGLDERLRRRLCIHRLRAIRPKEGQPGWSGHRFAGCWPDNRAEPLVCR